MKKTFLIESERARVKDLSSQAIKKNKNQSEIFSLDLAKSIAKKQLGIPFADIKITRVKNSNCDYREYSYRNLVLVREKTYIEKQRQMEEREIYPFLDQKRVDFVSVSERITSPEKNNSGFNLNLINLII